MNEQVLLDVRMDKSIDIENLTHKFNCQKYIYIPFDEIVSLEDTENALDKSKIYFVVCNSGNKSKYVCELLKEKGYNVFNIEGGVEKHIQSIAI